MMLTIVDDNALVPLNVTIPDGVTLLYDASGTGKTFLFRLLEGYALDNGLSCTVINGSNYTSVQFRGVYDLIILDNADLYATREFLDDCYKHSKHIICSAKQLLSATEARIFISSLEYKERVLQVEINDVFI